MSKTIFESPNGPKPMGAYTVATGASGLMFISGQVGVDPSTGVRAEGVRDQTSQIMRNLSSILSDSGVSLADVVKTTIFLTNIDDFAAVNEIYSSYFDEAPPARSTVAVAALPGGFLVEVEAIATTDRSTNDD